MIKHNNAIPTIENSAIPNVCLCFFFGIGVGIGAIPPPAFDCSSRVIGGIFIPSRREISLVTLPNDSSGCGKASIQLRFLR